MKRLITFTVVFTVVFCTSCKEKPDNGGGGGEDTTVVIPPKKYVIGGYYNVNGVEGIVYKIIGEDSTKGMIVSLDETDARWGNNVETGAIDADNGQKNMEKIKAKGIEDYPAFKWCDDKKNGWYLPAQNELWDVAKIHRDIQDSLEVYGGNKLSSASDYWSSTERFNPGAPAGTEYQSAYTVRLSDAFISPDGVDRTTVRKVRAVRSF